MCRNFQQIIHVFWTHTVSQLRYMHSSDRTLQCEHCNRPVSFTFDLNSDAGILQYCTLQCEHCSRPVTFTFWPQLRCRHATVLHHTVWMQCSETYLWSYFYFLPLLTTKYSVWRIFLKLNEQGLKDWTWHILKNGTASQVCPLPVPHPFPQTDTVSLCPFTGSRYVHVLAYNPTLEVKSWTLSL